MDILLLLVLLSCRIEAVRAQMTLSPLSLTVVRGDEARFTCNISGTPWTVMVWLLNGRAVLTISKEDGVLPSVDPNVTAVKCPNPQGDCWVFVLRSAQRNNQGQVTCDLQLVESRTAKLLIQEKTPQEVIRFDQSVFARGSVAEATGGKVNLGFCSEGPTDEYSNSDVIIRTYNQMRFDTFHKVPDVVHSSSISLHSESQTTEFQEEETYSNIRRITTV